MSDNYQPNLWWVFDSETKSFSTLPVGPVLTPAILLCCILYISKLILRSEPSYESRAGALASTQEWKEKRDRFYHLIQRRVDTNNDLTVKEMIEYRELEAYLKRVR